MNADYAIVGGGVVGMDMTYGLQTLGLKGLGADLP